MNAPRHRAVLGSIFDHARAAAASPQPVVGGFIGDVLGTIASPFVDIFTSVFDRIPGSDWARTAISNGATSVGDFAKTPVGFQVISVISGGLSQVAAPFVGPAVVNVAMATPGLVAGDSFTNAYTKGLTDYLEKASVVLGGAGGVAGAAAAGGGALISASGALAGSALGSQMQVLINNPDFQKALRDAADAAAKSNAPEVVLAQLGLSPDELAARFQTRPDVAALASNAVLHQMVYDMGRFDPATGREAPPKSSAQLRREILNAELANQAAAHLGGASLPFSTVSDQGLDALKRQLADAIAREGGAEPATDPTPPPPPPPAPSIPAVGFVRILHDPTPFSTRAKEIAILALVTSPLWGYGLLRARKILP